MQEIQPNNKKFALWTAFFSTVLVALVITNLLLSRQINRTSGTAQTASQDPGIKSENISLKNKTGSPVHANDFNGATPPDIQFAQWVVPSGKQFPANANAYRFKQHYTEESVEALAAKLKATGTMAKIDSNILSYALDRNNKQAAILAFNTDTGAFNYTTTEGLPLSGSPADKNTLEQKAYRFLEALGMYDSTMKMSATYRNSATPGLTYIEIHRSWTAVGGPILNTLGLSNVPENQHLSDLTMQTKYDDMNQDPTITDSTDNMNGLARQDDFNTITLAVSDNAGRVVGIRSTMRQLESTEGTPLALKSYDEAKNALQSNRFEFALTNPSGTGDAPWESIYPANVARATEATVTESALVYLEDSPTRIQSELTPYYVFRGSANLASGYLVNFIATVPAAKTGTHAKREWNLVSHVMAADIDNGQKQSTFDLSPAPTAIPTPYDNTSCNPTESQLNPIYNQGGTRFGWSNVKVWEGKFTSSRKGYWYYVPESGTTASSLQSEINKVIVQVRSLTGETEYRQFDKILQDYNLRGNSCPVRVSGASPTLFIYGKPGETVRISPQTTLTYADPAVDGTNAWHATITDKGVIANGYARPYLYYEYKPVVFTKPKAGWIVKKDTIDTWVQDLSQALTLTDVESERLSFELHHAARSVLAPYLFIGMIDSNELNTRLPLHVSSGFRVTRLQFFVSSSPSTAVSTASFPAALSRSESMVLEIGAIAE